MDEVDLFPDLLNVDGHDRDHSTGHAHLKGITQSVAYRLIGKPLQLRVIPQRILSANGLLPLGFFGYGVFSRRLNKLAQA